MIIVGVTSVLALILGSFMPLRWGLIGLLGAAALLFILQAAIRTASGFEGTSIDESLLLFNGSWAAYIGFNVQVTYRAFAFPLLALAAPLILRCARRIR